MFQNFSNSYYLNSYWVVQDINNNKINQDEYEGIKNNIYNNTTPIIMKLGSIHFEIEGDSNIPSNTIQLSSDIISNAQFTRTPAEYPVLLTKPQFAKQIVKFKNNTIKSGIKNIGNS